MHPQRLVHFMCCGLSFRCSTVRWHFHRMPIRISITSHWSIVGSSVSVSLLFESIDSNHFAKVNVDNKRTMSDSSDDYLSRPRTDSSSSSGIEPELSGESVSYEKSIASTSDHATVTPASQEKRQRKRATPAKDNDAILREIQHLQESTENVMPKQAFERCVYPALAIGRHSMGSNYCLQLGARIIDRKRCRSLSQELPHHRRSIACAAGKRRNVYDAIFRGL